jgi:hypothetical protein
MWKISSIFICSLLVVDTFFLSYAVGLNSRTVKIVDPTLAAKAKPLDTKVTTSVATPVQTAPPPTTAKGQTQAAAQVLVNKFTDLGETDERLKAAVTQAAEAGIIDPTKDEKFRPNDPVTRAEFTRWMVRVRQTPITSSSTAQTYQDVEPFTKYFDEIEGATKAIMVQGYNIKGSKAKEFKPEQHITREEFAVMYGTFSGKRGRAEKLNKEEIEKYLKYDPDKSTYGALTYQDAGDIDDWARKWVAVANQAGVLEQAFDVTPYAADGAKKLLHPQQKMTRAEAVNILVKLYGIHSRNVVEILETLDKQGMLADRPGEYENAEALYKGAVTIKEKALGQDNPAVAQSLTKLASMYDALGNHANAEQLHSRALQIREKALGKNHEDVADSMHDLAASFAAAGKLKEAENTYNKLLARDQQIAGKASAPVASDLTNLARVQLLQGKKADAEATQKRAIEVKKKLQGSQFIQVVPAFAPAAVPSNAPSDIKDKWALVIGISDFKDPTINLKYAAKDAIDFKNYLITEEHFKTDHVKLLTNNKATRQNISDMLTTGWLGRLANPGDLVVIYISSHGSQSKQDVGMNFLVVHDTNKNSLLTTGIPMQWLTKMIQESVHSDRVVLIMDVCHSGSTVDGSGDKGLIRQGFDVSKVAMGSGQAVLCSSLADQVSWESKSYPNSVFTRRLLEALRSKGDKTKLTDAYQHLKDKVESEVLRDRGEEQTPVLNMKSWTGGEPVLGATPSNPRPGL